MLGYPDFSCQFELQTDTSLQGLGTMLTQGEKGCKWNKSCYSICQLVPVAKGAINVRLYLSKIGIISTEVGGDEKSERLCLRILVHNIY